MADLTLRLVKGTELTFGELDANFQSLDSDIVTLTARFDSFEGERGLDSAQAIGIINETVDSAYVELMYSKIDQFRDSVFVQDIITDTVDSAFISSLGSYTTAKHDSDTLAQVDSAYIQARSDHYMDSDVRVLVDSSYVRLRADSGYVQSAIDSAYIKHVVDSTYVGTVAGYGNDDVTDLLDSFNGHIIPEVGETYDLGTNLRRWRSIYAKDAYVSLATIFFSDSAETPQTSLSIDSSGEFKVSSPSGVGLIAKTTTGNAIDSNTILSIIDSAYIQTRQTAAGGGLDSATTLGLIDSAYIQARQVDVDTVRDSAFITSIVDAAYVQSRQVDVDTVRDSAFVSGIVDAAYVQSRVTFPTDQVGIDSAVSISLTQSTIDSAYVQARVTFPTDNVGIDSAKTVALIDSAYVQARQVDLNTQRDSGFVTDIVDAAYVQARVTFPADQVGIDSAVSIGLTQSTVDSAYVQARVTLDGVGISNLVEDTTPQLGGNLDVNSNNVQFGDSGKAQFGAGPDLEMYHDGSNSFINDVGDGSIFIRSGTTYFQNAAGTKTSFQTNSGGAQKFFFNNDLKIETVDSGAKVTGNLTVTGHVEQTGPRMIAGGRILTSSIFSQNGTVQKQLFGIFDSQQAPGGADGIQRISDGKYRFQLDSTNLGLISDPDDYTVMLTYDYSGDDPTASSRTLTVLGQTDSSFEVVVERADGGGNEDYASGIAHINFQVWLY